MNTASVLLAGEQKRLMRKYRALFIMLLPGLALITVFCYAPMYGVILAFKDFVITQGIMASPWAGFKYFQEAFRDQLFLQAVTNTFILAGWKLLAGTPVAILFALLLNEIKSLRYKRFVQTVSYLPYFMSWVILGGIFFSVLSLNGPINGLIELAGLDKVMFLGDSKYFRGVLIITDIWKSFGWSAVLYIAAISGIDQEMYEAARIDGSNRFQNMRYITLPSILSVICINFILSLSNILNANFDQVYNMYSVTVYDVSDIIDTYVYRVGLRGMKLSYGTAIGLFKSLVALALVFCSNTLIHKVGGKENALW